ncbi:tyrosine-protein kinase [Dyadobacter sp. CY326]|uniref:GumC family protein n=1 Tax=Dyadobacter sp. CY326 TaxID=2907300 RepID=UPI001F402689|nr:tyrosine-protein kinase [Dyadobacter sp. CY326]MCE7068074.1 polysaccharide biosynthesis tyrosine autokinase [Dyadobacter sp. CY326]
MKQEPTLATITSTRSTESGSIRTATLLLYDMWRNRYWVALSVAVSFALAFIYLRYTTPQFQITASILVRDDSKGSEFGDTAFLESMGLSSVESSVDNEVELLKSRTLMESVVEDLQLHVQYFSKGHVKTSELFEKSPFKLTLVSPGKVAVTKPVTYRLIVKKGRPYAFQINSKHFEASFGDTIHLPHAVAILTKTGNPISTDDAYAITISPPELVVNHYQKALIIAPTNKLVSTVNISINETLPKRGEAILEKLLFNYLKASIADKNRTSDSTINFINANLTQVSNELSDLEKQIEKFQRIHQVPDLDAHIRHLMNALDQHRQDRNRYAIQLQIVDSLSKFLAKNPDHIVPAQLFSHDPGFALLVEKYNEFQLALREKLITVTESHPKVHLLNVQLEQVRTSLLASVRAQQNDLQTGISALKTYESTTQNQLAEMPAIARQFVELKRQQQIKQDLYILLLKKRVETAISKSSTLANARVIDRPKAVPDPIKPNRQLIMLISGFVGIGFPLAVLHLKSLLNTRIVNKAEVTAHLSVPVLGEISHHNNSKITLLGDNVQSQIREQFRVLRTNILFLSASKPIQVIMLTSSMGGEGKSFVAVNLCNALALSGKKVLLLELDLRRPGIAKNLGLKVPGFTSYIAFTATLDDIIQPVQPAKTFDIITGGIIPPNPAEMLSLPEVDDMIRLLKTRYDFIIIDTPPIGLITDARLLSRFADLSLYIIRQHFTYKNQLDQIREIQDLNQLPRMHLILNDIKITPGYNYTYGYYEEKKRHFWDAFKKT